MNFNTTQKIIQLNKDFYKNISDDFSRTRQNPWKGWGRVVEKINENFKNKKSISVLDVGCGNGRFYRYLENNMKDLEIDYTGLDSNESLLTEARLKYDKAAWKHYDVILDLHNIKEKYDLAVAFGISHHIPGKEFRKKWFADLAGLIKPSGLLIFTTWNYDVDKRFKEKTISKSDKDMNLEEGDYLLGWGVTNAKRYVHIYSEDEINEIKKLLGMNLIDRYTADGRSNNLNDYLIFQFS